MPERDIINEVTGLINEFDNLDYSNVINLLGWFYKALEYNTMFEDLRISEYVYDKLKSNGYNAIHNIEEEMKSFNSLMNSKANPDIENIGKSIISQIMLSIKNNTYFDMSLIKIIQIFNERFNKQNVFSYMMDDLKKYIGCQIVYVVIKSGVRQLKTGMLLSFEPYKSIVVAEMSLNGEKIPFIGACVAICDIHSIDGKLLYSNSLIKDDYNLEDFKEIEELQLASFGNDNFTLERKGLM